jgi:hypothetical protein
MVGEQKPNTMSKLEPLFNFLYGLWVVRILPDIIAKSLLSPGTFSCRRNLDAA